MTRWPKKLQSCQMAARGHETLFKCSTENTPGDSIDVARLWRRSVKNGDAQVRRYAHSLPQHLPKSLHPT